MQTFYIYRKPIEEFKQLDTPSAHCDCLLISGSHEDVLDCLNNIIGQQTYSFYEQRNLVETVEVRYEQVKEVLQNALRQVSERYRPSIYQAQLGWFYSLEFYPEEYLTVLVFDES